MEKIDQWYGPVQHDVADTPDLEQVGEQLFTRIQQHLSTDRKVIPFHKKPFHKKPFFRIAVAAVWIGCLAVGGFMFMHRHQRLSSPVMAKSVANDIPAPTSSKATLILANGKSILLDTITSADAASASLAKVSGSDGTYRQVEDNSAGTTGNETYNVLYNPRGSKAISLILKDGTVVFLNADSRCRYAASMNGNERRVQIEGEAYFEVAKDERRPFIVVNRQKDVEVKVLGTHFNINTYDDEPTANITLLQGAVMVSHAHTSVVMRPGQQAQVADHLKLINDVDIEGAIAWKNGRFLFSEGTDIQTIMKQIARWYNVKVIYTGSIQQEFGGSISRSSSISQVLKVLEATGGVKCKIENNVITVSP
jgi:hypothetical protein